MLSNEEHSSLIFILKREIRRFKTKRPFARPTQTNSQKTGLKAKREGFCKTLIISLLDYFK